MEPQAQARALTRFTDRDTRRTAIDTHLTRRWDGLGGIEAGVRTPLFDDLSLA